tara:strand:- start:275 stop:484 length:210 start_codon:yes stop_codon:yes gene_type:complete
MSQNFSVKRRKGESSESLIKRFMKKTKKSKIVEKVRKRRYFEKASDKKRLAKQKAIRDAKKKNKKETKR